MKRFLFYGLVMLVTFALGCGLEQVIRYRLANEVAPVAQLPPAEQYIIPFPATPVTPAAAVNAEPSQPTPTLIFDYDRKKLIRFGIFYVHGRAPRDFADFHSIELDLIGAEPPYDGYISINTVSGVDQYDSAKAQFAFVTERRLFFVTSPTRGSGVEYWFDGEFLTNNLHSMQGKNKAALRGKLTKTKNGRKIAERVISFLVEHMGC